MRRRDWLLLLLTLGESPPGLDPVRLQKGMFLLAQEGVIPSEERYRFIPYNYGPMSPGVYRDVDVLVRLRLAERYDVPGYPWRGVRPTTHGLEAGARLVAQADGDPGTAATLRLLAAIRGRIVGMGFSELLSFIYDRYPWVAARTVFRRS
jgi:hypothetical protein